MHPETRLVRFIDRLRISLAAGGIAVLARIIATGEPVGAGVCLVAFQSWLQ